MFVLYCTAVFVCCTCFELVTVYVVLSRQCSCEANCCKGPPTVKRLKGVFLCNCVYVCLNMSHHSVPDGALFAPLVRGESDVRAGDKRAA